LSRHRDAIFAAGNARSHRDYAGTYAPCDDRMAGMSPPALCARPAPRILPMCCTASGRLILPDWRFVLPADVPLWKVNRRRPHVDELNRARKGPVFFWAEDR